MKQSDLGEREVRQGKAQTIQCDTLSHWIMIHYEFQKDPEIPEPVGLLIRSARRNLTWKWSTGKKGGELALLSPISPPLLVSVHHPGY